MALIGYARISTTEQKLEPQVDALKAAGCETVFEDVISGAKAERPGLNNALAFLRKGDTLLVWKLDRLGRSMKHLVETVTDLGDRGVGFKSLTEGVDTTTTGGTLVFHLFGALAEFERDLIVERTQAGLKAAATRGRKGGRKPVVTLKKLEQAKAHISDGLTVREAAARLKISKTSLYNALRGQKPD
ncbi:MULTISPECIES: recombinase family protein [Alphaproteobacteria]|nr:MULTISPECIES: recombinase family protein [Sulfitobacter]MAJ76955.1 invertase [Roseobacter sp.]MBB59541.1 invertase [Rhodospirillaceae bacterium]HBK16990.1 recombinase family protein [Gammaproteobacteria bacterium]AXI52958.1 recombinase family protein [Sulfitobacter sp. SK025]AXI52981.1 recombinase family protein [Sulfitobacter sp. SK025]